ncbi:hypothetical protein H6P81_012859 [Aristolochia fimbriata]|uniref:Lipid II flippase MurJ n=1 Tax=Aristolochia fimbriata TaxID=158543 RepID=A0AAV7EG55_ARIFI|nr:hypothetical protein H6P81_012859 [Aristolochia fimbriata]
MAAASPHFGAPLGVRSGRFHLSNRHYYTQVKLINDRSSSNPFLRSKTSWSLPFAEFHSKAHRDDSVSSLSSSSKSGELRHAGFITLATIASKVLGMLREMALAAVFGVGPVASAFKHSLVLPSFFIALVGGVKGPIHVTVATTLSKLSKENRKRLIQNAHAAMFMIGGILGALVYIFADFIVHLSAPGLWASIEGQIVKDIAIRQLKVMTPCILFAGPVALGFGSLSAERDHIVPSLSPALASIIVILSCAVYISVSPSSTSSSREIFGGMLISSAASLGVFLQWVIQVLLHEKTGFKFTFFSWKNILEDKNLCELFALVFPAVLTSGLAQVASFTDLYFASYVPHATAGISYARLLATAPLGILLSTVILPLLPKYSRLIKSSSWTALKENLHQTFLLCMALVFAISTFMCVLARPIIYLIFQRFAFDSKATALVSSLFICYSIGSPFYVMRELLVMVFYALGDARLPFIISGLAIIFNAFLDWLFTFKFGLGAQGLVLATSVVSALSALTLLHLLSRRLKGVIGVTEVLCPLALLITCSVISGNVTLITYNILDCILSSVLFLRCSRLSDFLSIAFASLFGLSSFSVPLLIFQFPRMKLRRSFSKKLSN